MKRNKKKFTYQISFDIPIKKGFRICPDSPKWITQTIKDNLKTDYFLLFNDDTMDNKEQSLRNIKIKRIK